MKRRKKINAKRCVGNSNFCVNSVVCWFQGHPKFRDGFPFDTKVNARAYIRRDE